MRTVIVILRRLLISKDEALENIKIERQAGRFLYAPFLYLHYMTSDTKSVYRIAVVLEK